MKEHYFKKKSWLNLRDKLRKWSTKKLKTSLILSLIAFQGYSASFAQQITINVKNASLESVIKEIRRQAKMQIIYNADLVKKVKAVNIDVNSTSIEKVLTKLLAENGLDYSIENDIIIIKEKHNPYPVILKSQQQQFIAAGVILDSIGNVLPGVSIKESGTTNATTSNDRGEFGLKVANDKAQLDFSFIGYIDLLNRPVSREMRIVLSIDDTEIDEVVVVGYGEQKKQSIVSSVSSVKGESLRFPTRNLSNNIAGQVAGLIAVQRSGEPGYDNSEFWIRGISSFAGGNSPLVLVDGVPRTINDIEPDEIESFTVLKDAAATAVYGAEGANGVVIITSKRGQIQKPVIAFRTEHSILKPTRLPKFVGSADYLTLFNEALINDGEAPIYSDELINNYSLGADNDLYPNTNWMDALLRSTTDNHRYTLNVRGGTEKAKYFVSGAYFSESGIFKDDPDKRYDTNIGVKRFNLRSNVDLEVSPTTIVGVDLSGQYLMTNYPGTGTGTIFRQMLLTPPYVFPPTYSDGTISTFPKERDSNMKNPYNMLMHSGYAKEWRSSIQSNVKLNQRLDFITEGLFFRGNLSYDYYGNYNQRRNYNPSRYYATGRDENGNLIFDRTFSGSPDLSDPTQSSSSDKKIYIESSLNYSRIIGNHTFGAMALYMQKEGHAFNQTLPSRKQGVVGRVTYGFDNKYFMEGNFGYTGSETFAKGHRFGLFPAVGIGYQVSNENFYPESLKKYVSTLKLRFSAGRTGNDNTGGDRFLYRPTFKMDAPGFSQGITSGGSSNGLGNGITEARFEAPHIGWEIEDKFNYGVDLSLFNNTIDINVDYFNTERSGILLQRRTVLASGGFRQSPWQNYGRVKNWGVDGSISSHHKIGQIAIGTRGTFTLAKNKILEYDELPQPHPWMSVTGTRVNENTLYIAERLYTEEDFYQITNTNGAKSYTLKEGIPTPTLGGIIGPGDIKYKDLNGDGVIDAFDRKRGVGHPYNPEIVYGFGVNLEYKGVYISAFFQGVANSTVVLGGDLPAGWFPFAWGVDQSNFRSFALDRWTEENPSQNVFMPRIHSSNVNAANNNVQSTWWTRSGNFLRFKNFEIGYNIPKTFLEKHGIGTSRIYLMGHNLAVWDSIKFWDPETGNGNSGANYPLSRSFTFGLELSF
ncbi:TonB-dependent receptor [Sphingobacterium sp. UT-1RO-CII-1]|uniref:TonB-dependent receptor n=1 Tax=Sphingobacterium sp. UT-1RO-CII-1 TaxID=2995225 RepID=UPI00227BF776|nr:TonB-dependent receptor [Sphingobacterium sp. UT-1RO-CII-1]MCY4778661.1 TonB-dependent receptor [Sphingobacterium sp. UT-1RO-CII-1]